MSDVKDINKQIKKTIIELIFTIMIFIGALFVWFNIDFSVAGSVSKNSSNNGEISIEQIKPLSLNYIAPISDEEAIKNYEKAILKISNNKNITSRYELIYRISNDSTLNPDFIKFQLSNTKISKIDFLKNLEVKASDNYTDYILYIDEIAPNNSLDFSFIIWIDKNAGNDAQGKDLFSSFIVNSYDTHISLK